MQLKTIAWSVSPCGPTQGSVSVLWENSGAGGTHSTIMTCVGNGMNEYSMMGIPMKNDCNNPTGNLLVNSSLGASGTYSILLDVAYPVSGKPIT